MFNINIIIKERYNIIKNLKCINLCIYICIKSLM